MLTWISDSIISCVSNCSFIEISPSRWSNLRRQNFYHVRNGVLKLQCMNALLTNSLLNSFLLEIHAINHDHESDEITENLKNATVFVSQIHYSLHSLNLALLVPIERMADDDGRRH